MSGKQELCPSPDALRARRGRGKVEYLACLKEIQAMQAKGYTPIMIYAALKEEKKITISRSQFWRHLSGKCGPPPQIMNRNGPPLPSGSTFSAQTSGLPALPSPAMEMPPALPAPVKPPNTGINEFQPVKFVEEAVPSTSTVTEPS